MLLLLGAVVAVVVLFVAVIVDVGAEVVTVVAAVVNVLVVDVDVVLMVLSTAHLVGGGRGDEGENHGGGGERAGLPRTVELHDIVIMQFVVAAIEEKLGRKQGSKKKTA